MYPNLLDMYNQDVYHPVTGELLPKGAYLAVQVNCMRYKDGDGVVREIHMPNGTQKAATKYLEEENWAELAKFDEYNGQGYKPEDYEICYPHPLDEDGNPIEEPAKDKEDASKPAEE